MSALANIPNAAAPVSASDMPIPLLTNPHYIPRAPGPHARALAERIGTADQLRAESSDRAARAARLNRTMG
jgi:hypothetical protein